MRPRWILTGVALFFAAQAAFGQSKDKKKESEKLAKAEELFTEAERYFSVGEYEKALEDYKQSYILSGAPELLFNIGQCQRQLKQFEEAEKSYQAFLRQVPETDPTRPKVEALIQEIEDAIAKEKSATKVEPQGTLSTQPASMEGP